MKLKDYFKIILAEKVNKKENPDSKVFEKWITYIDFAWVINLHQLASVLCSTRLLEQHLEIEDMDQGRGSRTFDLSNILAWMFSDSQSQVGCPQWNHNQSWTENQCSEDKHRIDKQWCWMGDTRTHQSQMSNTKEQVESFVYSGRAVQDLGRWLGTRC